MDLSVFITAFVALGLLTLLAAAAAAPAPALRASRLTMAAALGAVLTAWIIAERLPVAAHPAGWRVATVLLVLTGVGGVATLLLQRRHVRQQAEAAARAGRPVLPWHWPAGICAAVAFAVTLTAAWALTAGVEAFYGVAVDPLLAASDPTGQAEAADVSQAALAWAGALFVVITGSLLLTVSVPLAVFLRQRRRIRRDTERYLTALLDEPERV